MPDGVTEPEGLFNLPGVTVVPAAAGAGMLPQIGDYEALQFAIPKEFRKEMNYGLCWVGNDTAYKNARGIKVNDPADERRIFGYNQQDYMFFGFPYKVQNDIPANMIACWMPHRYRLYRRAGMEMRVERAGETLALANKELIVCRSRWGGGQDHAKSMAKIIDAAA